MTGFATHAQVEHEAGIVGGKAPELGGGHPAIPKELFYSADQHATPDLVRLVGCDRGPEAPREILLV
ncbi:MAG: hypothetical protein A3J40_10695 [Erythrobacter sp. RIFCSPHIGHO2_12_FULL_63_10]|nr:MAG: hypothetical protein A3J40_10695 [Erythrobacter sp. RIFCSPHIGHO2_12_FULL_63_10]